jgi:hypothetical protein
LLIALCLPNGTALLSLFMLFPFFLFIYSYVHTLLRSFLPSFPSTCPSPHPSRFQAEPVLPFSPILLKRRHKQY